MRSLRVSCCIAEIGRAADPLTGNTTAQPINPQPSAVTTIIMTSRLMTVYVRPLLKSLREAGCDSAHVAQYSLHRRRYPGFTVYSIPD